jgi:hypothetical protein
MLTKYRMKVGDGTFVMEVSSKLKNACSSEKGDNSFDVLLEDFGTISRMVSALTSVNFCSLSPSSLRVAPELISMLNFFPLHRTDILCIHSGFSMLCSKKKQCENSFLH